MNFIQTHMTKQSRVKQNNEIDRLSILISIQKQKLVTALSNIDIDEYDEGLSLVTLGLSDLNLLKGFAIVDSNLQSILEYLEFVNVTSDKLEYIKVRYTEYKLSCLRLDELMDDSTLVAV